MKYFGSFTLLLTLGALGISAEPSPRVAWYGTLTSGLQAAKAANRPILLVSAAPHCLGVPGIW